MRCAIERERFERKQRRVSPSTFAKDGDCLATLECVKGRREQFLIVL